MSSERLESPVQPDDDEPRPEDVVVTCSGGVKLPPMSALFPQPEPRKDPDGE